MDIRPRRLGGTACLWDKLIDYSVRRHRVITRFLRHSKLVQLLATVASANCAINRPSFILMDYPLAYYAAGQDVVNEVAILLVDSI